MESRSRSAGSSFASHWNALYRGDLGLSKRSPEICRKCVYASTKTSSPELGAPVSGGFPSVGVAKVGLWVDAGDATGTDMGGAIGEIVGVVVISKCESVGNAGDTIGAADGMVVVEVTASELGDSVSEKGCDVRSTVGEMVGDDAVLFPDPFENKARFKESPRPPKASNDTTIKTDIIARQPHGNMIHRIFSRSVFLVSDTEDSVEPPPILSSSRYAPLSSDIGT